MFRCEICNYNANTKAVLTRHLSTKKHITLSSTTPSPVEVVAEPEPESKVEDKLQCKKCNKEFKNKSGLERHILKCNKSQELVTYDTEKKDSDSDTENKKEDNENKEEEVDDKKEYEHNITRLIVEIIRNRYEFEIETEHLKKSYEQKITEMKTEFERIYIAKEIEIKNLQAQIQKLTKKK
jgi:hypothetical protein